MKNTNEPPPIHLSGNPDYFRPDNGHIKVTDDGTDLIIMGVDTYIYPNIWKFRADVYYGGELIYSQCDGSYWTLTKLMFMGIFRTTRFDRVNMGKET